MHKVKNINELRQIIKEGKVPLDTLDVSSGILPFFIIFFN